MKNGGPYCDCIFYKREPCFHDLDCAPRADSTTSFIVSKFAFMIKKEGVEYWLILPEND